MRWLSQLLNPTLEQLVRKQKYVSVFTKLLSDETREEMEHKLTELGAPMLPEFEEILYSFDNESAIEKAILNADAREMKATYTKIMGNTTMILKKGAFISDSDGLYKLRCSMMRIISDIDAPDSLDILEPAATRFVHRGKEQLIPLIAKLSNPKARDLVVSIVSEWDDDDLTKYSTIWWDIFERPGPHGMAILIDCLTADSPSLRGEVATYLYTNMSTYRAVNSLTEEQVWLAKLVLENVEPLNLPESYREFFPIGQVFEMAARKYGADLKPEDATIPMEYVGEMWRKIWNTHAFSEFTFDDVQAIGNSSEDANWVLQVLKDGGYVKTTGLRRFACVVEPNERYSRD